MCICAVIFLCQIYELQKRLSPDLQYSNFTLSAQSSTTRFAQPNNPHSCFATRQIYYNPGTTAHFHQNVQCLSLSLSLKNGFFPLLYRCSGNLLSNLLSSVPVLSCCGTGRAFIVCLSFLAQRGVYLPDQTLPLKSHRLLSRHEL